MALIVLLGAAALQGAEKAPAPSAITNDELAAFAEDSGYVTEAETIGTGRILRNRLRLWPVVDPQGPSEGIKRIIRGGGWNTAPGERPCD
jgi:hypothetical protein